MPLAEFDDVSIKYHSIGDGEPIIFISGMGMDHRVWFNQVSYFSDKYRVIVFDNRGIGESKYNGKRFSTYDLAEDVINLMDFLKIEKANIVGSSLGGMVAQEIAINFPNRIDKLVLSSTTAKLEKIGNFFKNINRIFKGEVEIILDIDPSHPIFNRSLNYILQNTYSREFLIENKKFFEKMAKEYLRKEEYFEVVLKQIGAALRHDTRKRLKLIRSKTLILAGSDDKLIPCEYGMKLSMGIRKSRYIEIKGGTHGLHLEKVDEFNRYLEKFLLS